MNLLILLIAMGVIGIIGVIGTIEYSHAQEQTPLRLYHPDTPAPQETRTGISLFNGVPKWYFLPVNIAVIQKSGETAIGHIYTTPNLNIDHPLLGQKQG